MSRGNFVRGPARHNFAGYRVREGGYAKVYAPDHPRASCDGYVREHLLVAEAALGRPLRRPECVHHVDEDRTHNAPWNLVICPDDRYHKLLHRRRAALHATGNPNAPRCEVCKRWELPNDDVIRQYPVRRNGRVYNYRALHLTCNAARVGAHHRKKVGRWATDQLVTG